MIPDKSKILSLYQQSIQSNPKRNEGWVTHTICVGDTAGKIAAALNAVGQNYDVEKVILLGYLHDIGKMVGTFEDHPIDGYRYLCANNYDEEYCNISLSHHFINNDETCVLSTVPDPEHDREMIKFVRKHRFTPEEKIIILCDSMCNLNIMTLDDRIADILSRHGTNPKTQERITETMKLKRSIDDILGYDLYNLFPEIKNDR